MRMQKYFAEPEQPGKQEFIRGRVIRTPIAPLRCSMVWNQLTADLPAKPKDKEAGFSGGGQASTSVSKRLPQGL